jgi:hypothetical protein
MRNTVWMGLLTAVGALLACKTSEHRTQERIAAAETGATRPQPGPSVDIASPPAGGISPLAEQLNAIRRKPADFATGKEDYGGATITFRLKPIEGIESAVFVGYRGDPKAWRFGLEGIHCERVRELGIEVVELVHGDGRPLSASWFLIKGGPLENAWVKVFPGESALLCNVMPGRQEYWQREHDTPKQ